MAGMYSAFSDLDYYNDPEPVCPSRECSCPDCTWQRQEEDLRQQLEEDGEVARLQNGEAA